MSPDRTMPVRIQVPVWLMGLFAFLAAVGAAAFIIGVNRPDPLRTWQTYLINFVFWTGLSFGQACFVAVINVTGATWARPLKRLSEALAAYLPVGFLLFWVLYLGKDYLFPWIAHPVADKEAWLNAPFLFARDGAAIFLLSLLSVSMVYFSTRGASGKDEVTQGGADGGATVGGRSWRCQTLLSPAVLVAYAFVMTLLGFDLVMSLDPHWYSSLFGGYFFIGSFYTGIAALYFVATVVSGSEAMKGHVYPRHFHDLGKLAFAFCLFTGYLFYAQFLVIWYGNMPEETRYVILRVRLTPWEPLAWTVFAMTFAAPFVLLLGRRAKLLHPLALAVSIVILTGMWLEKVILVAPSLWKGGKIPLGLTEALVTVGFLGVFGLAAAFFLRRTTALPVTDPVFVESASHPETRLAP